ncbi:BBP7 family outer membrane beta-barrel protein [Zavarzinella formosa]|uniref:BBP7 family outer membrane beta-barrel protein n=1 Tax=Zavarzinella formosa TaxID=360055 RepID=UPI00031473E5|nr:BBP7 family outer membrane beta-barrel protein [Zavarzinella formosa]
MILWPPLMNVRRFLLLAFCLGIGFLPNNVRAEEPFVVAADDRESWRELIPLEPIQPERVWLRGEYLLWLTVSGKLLKLAQAFNFELPPVASRLVSGESVGPVSLHQPFGSDRQGYRLTAGAWLDNEQTIGVEGSLTYLTRSPGRLIFQPGDRAVLGDTLGLSVGVPAIQGRPPKIVVVPVQVPDLVKGGLSLELGAKTLFGGELAGRFGLVEGDGWRIDGLAGYRYLDYRESLRAVAGVVTVAKFLNPGTAIVSRDEITTKNSYNGFLLGFQADATWNDWTLTIRPRVSIAVADREVTREGLTQIILPGGGRLVKQEGTYLLKQDMGDFRANEVTALPELDLGLSYAVTSNLRLFAGTSALFLPVVAKANNQLQLGIRPDRLPAGMATKLDSLPPLNSGEPPIRNNLLLISMSLGMEFRF